MKENPLPKIIVAVTGASGAIYAQTILMQLQSMQEQLAEVAVVFTDNAKNVWLHELQNRDYETLPFQQFPNQDFFAPIASGSAGYDAMIICPCSMGALGRIAHGISDDLISRAADVMLKESRTLVLVPRESPLNLIHLNNLKTLAEAGARICPASPSFYSRPADIATLASTVTSRALKLIGLHPQMFEWGKDSE